MKIRQLLISFLLVASTLGATAQVSKTYYVSKPGTLISMMTEEEANSITHLTLTGKLNAEDFRHLRDEFPSLKVLDISNAEIKMYSGKAGGQTDISGTLLSHLMRGKMQQADTQKVDSLLTILKKKDYLPGRLPSVSKENPGFSNAPLPSEVISIKEYMNGMSTFIQYLTK